MRFQLLVYRMPMNPASARVAVWRSLKKIGAVYPQQSVCVFPANATITRELAPILRKIEEAGGDFHLLPLAPLSEEEERKLIVLFLDQAAKHYGEIIENCEVNFTKEIEFETFRQNFTYEEAEEIRAEYEKIVSWFNRVRRRDWFGAPNRDEAERWLARCEQLLEEFEARVYEVQTQEGEAAAPVHPHGRRTGRSRLAAMPRTGDTTGG
jgi:hypothetical protein